MAARLNTHRTIALLMFGVALLLIGGIINAAIAQSASYLQYQTPINPLDDPAVMQSVLKYAVLDPIGDQLVEDIATDLFANMPRDAMQIKYAIDQQRYYATELRQAQIAHGTVSTSGSASLLIGGLGVIGGFLYLRWRRKHPARKPIWAWKRSK